MNTRAVPRIHSRANEEKPLTRPSATLSPSDGERDGVRGFPESHTGKHSSSLRLLKLSLLVTVLCGVVSATASARVTISFDADWRFLKADAPGAEQTAFDDSQWRKLDVPHDWSIEGPFAKTNKTGGAGGWAPSGVGWYRKHFTLPTEQKGKRVYIEFDGVMQNSEVWINGVSLGKRPNGYVSFGYDLTEHVTFGEKKPNVLAVRADTSAQPASRWYSGAGLYRHVRLVIKDPIHIPQWGVFVKTLEANASEAKMQFKTSITNDSGTEAKIQLRLQVLDPAGIAQRDITTDFTIDSRVYSEIGLLIEKPQLWSIESPKLYSVVSRILVNGQSIDEQTTWFGIRVAEFKSATGFSLNGKNFKLYGVCLHHDGGAFGAAVPLGIWEDRLKTLRSLGVNAIRTAHNPPAPDFLDLCDRLGFLVMDEFFDCWTVGKNPHDYHLYFEEWSKRDAADTVRRDRNHPSVILYSIGNEIHDTPKPDIAIPIARGLVEVCHENDPTRPVTQALFRPNVSHDYDNGLADLLDVVGTNYRDNELLAAQRAKPSRKIIGTEQRHDRETWLNLRDHPSHAGQFLWTGVDYLGETRSWPLVAHASGLLDRTGEVKPRAFERQSWWSEAPMVRIVRRVAPDDKMPTDPGYGGAELHTQVEFADWTPRNPASHDESVHAYSNCEEVELFLNGKSLGAKPINRDATPRVWKVSYEPGTLKAVARNKDKVIATDELRTAGKAAKIILTTDRPKLSPAWDEVAFVNATVVDENGVVVPRANDLISFELTGPSVIAAVDSADNSSHEPFQANERRAYAGRCQVLVKATSASGEITIAASAPDLAGASVVIEASPAR
ncbi:MAG: glycoside hydrolase family 2 protein [Verrucomicrobia bacterium]|nr:MAG: glycoside hydrolase family 2 protein [Verrucomicrobiota bacterium]